MTGRDVIVSGESLELAGKFLEAAAVYESALADVDAAVVADARFHVGRLHWKQSKFDEAMREYDVARGLAVKHDLRELRARIENGQGVIHQVRGELSQAKACYGVALELATDGVQRGRVSLNLGTIANIEGDFESARSHYARARSIFQQAGFPEGEAMALHNLGMLNADEGRWDDADDSYRRCLELLERIGDRQMVALVLVNQSELRCVREQFEEAVGNCDRALSIFGEIGDEAGRGEALRWKGRALRSLGRREDAERILQETVRIAKRTGVLLLEAEASLDLGLSCTDRGDGPQAKRWLKRALELFEALGAQRDAEAVRVALSAWATQP